ncbi:hypothetical protein C2869_04725 [Saccharobesus litoralis]|uniref:Agarase n=1 Tax=Saccharobesus litoralis TaxID=2172099 RepID=A0A2S0VNL5_9ALTE|nr:hypothetical protein [Saccharobesus litoralis]AWB65783.1 hypothetical protein C2869_04725 [Saccharobesus litoralis]
MKVRAGKHRFTSLTTAIVTSLALAACGGGGGSSDDGQNGGQPQTDTTPNQFTFIDQNNVALASQITSAAITVNGINAESTISISGGEYAIGNGSFTSASGTVSNNQSVKVRLTSSSTNNSEAKATLTIGGVSDEFNVTTLAANTPDTTPNTFSFSAQTDVAKNSVIESNEITVTGIDAAATINISGGEYAIDGASYTTNAGTITNNQKVKVRLTSASQDNSAVQATLTIGGVNAVFTATTAAAFSGIQVDVNFDTKHSIGGIDSFDRRKYITIHSTQSEGDWGQGDNHSLGANNKDPNLAVNFVTDYDVYFGRSTGANKWQLRNVEQDASKPGFADEASLSKQGGNARWAYSNGTWSESLKIGRTIEDRGTDNIEGAQQHPFWPEGTLVKTLVKDENDNLVPDWAFSTTDSDAEPLGTATGHYLAHYLANYYRKKAGGDGGLKPKYFEVMNEPLYDLVTDRTGSEKVDPKVIFDFHNTVAAEIRKLPENDDILVGGYTVAFPDFDKDNFQRWHDRDKLFIDTAGANMDFYAIHLYDFPCLGQTEKYRKGSNMEATMDMMEHYSRIKLGEMKPYVVSEYGAAIHCMYKQGWSAARNTYQMRAANSMLMSFLERPDVIAKTIPFFVVKAEWGREKEAPFYPYGPRLMIQEFERTGDDTQTDWVYSDLILFYQLWAEVKGTRVDTWASDLDIQVDSYVDGKDAYIILNSLEFEDKEIKLNTLGLNANTVAGVNIKHLVASKDDDQVSSIVETNPVGIPSTVTLNAESTMIIKVTFANDVTIDQTNEESKYYATEYLKPISANTEIEFDINNVNLGSQGEAILRLAIGRDHGKSLLPTVKVNDTAVTVPSDFRGYDQTKGKVHTGRDNFFGAIEIPVPYSALQGSNKIKIEFNDDGGYVASAAMQVFNTSKALARSN